MLDENGRYTKLTLDQARAIVLQKAADAGVEVLAGSVEDQLKEWLAGTYVDIDSAQYALIVKMFNPSGPDIDIQNPGFPRLQPTTAKGFLEVDNTDGDGVVSVPLNTVVTAPNGNTYTNPANVVTVAVGEIGFVSVESVATGKAQNLPQDQVFTGVSGTGVIVTNPQPFTGGLDLETDSDYINRLIFYKSNNTSRQATTEARKELLEFYQDARFYVNSSNNGYAVPIPIPPQGLNAVVLFDSGITVGPEELAEAIQILTNRFEFGNLNSYATVLHPVIQGTSYSGIFPQVYAITPAQAVDSHVYAEVSVHFEAQTLPEEKAIFAETFATQFVQRLINLLSGAEGAFNFTFIPMADDPVESTPAVVSSAVGPSIAPFISIEAVRALISGGITAGDLSALGGMNFVSVDNLNIEFDPGAYEQSPILLSIFAPYEGTLATVDFVIDSLFSDGSSWYDRFISLDPSKITVIIKEA